jgi:integrase
MARNSFQTGSVRPRKTKRRGIVWELRYRVRDETSGTGWRDVTETAPPQCRVERDALKRLSEKLREINGRNSSRCGSSSKTRTITFEDFVETDWRSYVQNRDLKPSTLYSYQSMIDNYLTPEFGEKLLTEIGPVDLTDFFEQARAGKRKKYLLNLYSLLRVMFEVALENDRVERSPVRRKLHRPVGADVRSYRTKKSALSGEEIQRVLRQMPDEYRTLFTCVAMTGLRVGELLGLRWSNVDFGRHELSITHSLWRRQLVTPKTEASARTLHLPAVLTELLAKHQQNGPFNSAEDFVFARADGTPQDPDYLRKEVLYQALLAAGIKPGYRSHGFHLFRHSAGSIVHSITRDVKTTQELLGHSRLSTTADIYTHVDKVVGEEASEALAKAILPDLDIALASEKVQ